MCLRMPALLCPALLCAGGVLLAGCSTPTRIQPIAPPTAAASSAPKLSSAVSTADYRVDAAYHLYGKNRDRIFEGVLPHYLRAVGVLEVDVNAQGQIVTLRWLRAPTHAPEVMAEIERMVRQAAPFPVPVRLDLGNEPIRLVETWLWDQSGKFQLHSLSEGQGTRGTPPRLQPPPLPIWQPVRVHLVAADGR